MSGVTAGAGVPKGKRCGSWNNGKKAWEITGGSRESKGKVGKGGDQEQWVAVAMVVVAPRPKAGGAQRKLSGNWDKEKKAGEVGGGSRENKG